MYHLNFHTKMMIFDIVNHLKHIPLKALIAQWVHSFKCRHGLTFYRHSYDLQGLQSRHTGLKQSYGIRQNQFITVSCLRGSNKMIFTMIHFGRKEYL